MDGFRRTVSSGLRQIAFLLIPAAAVSAVLAEPIVRILFQRGHFTAAQTPVVAGALAAFSAGLVFNGAMLMLNRGFFSLQSNWIPTVVALGNLFLNAVLDFAFYRFGVWGIPLSTAVCNLAGTWALLVLLRRRLAPDRGRRDRVDDDPGRGRLGGRGGGRVDGLASARLGARPLVRGPGRLARARRSRAAMLTSTSSAAGCCRCASSRRCSRCALGSAGPDGRRRASQATTD